jgi:hypothetical protein
MGVKKRQSIASEYKFKQALQRQYGGVSNYKATTALKLSSGDDGDRHGASHC